MQVIVILLQLERAGQRKTRRGPSDAAADEMRLRVISFAERCMHAPWDPSDPSEATLGQVIAAASCRSYFLRGKQGPWKADFESWARSGSWAGERGIPIEARMDGDDEAWKHF